MHELVFIAKNFDLGKFKKICNAIKCNKFPSKEVVIFELDLRTLRKKELVSIYLCPEHADSGKLKDLVSELNNICEKGKIIEKKSFDVGFVTY